MNNKVVILSDIISLKKNLSEDLVDTFHQVTAVDKALTEIGYKSYKIKFETDLKKTEKKIIKAKPLFVFNLVESEDKSLYPVILLENMKIPFTGATAATLVLTNNKSVMKTIVLNSKLKFLKTPLYFTENNTKNIIFKKPKTFIFKELEFHSSINLDESLIIKFKMDFLAEEYIEGREFNVAILNGNILPVQEIEFKNYPKEKPKIICYKAKWDEDSFEYKNTVRRYVFNKKDIKVIKNLKKSAQECINLFNIGGYARIDYRVTGKGVPYIIDINANPCISPDSGFFAACKMTGLSYKDMVKKIIEPVCVTNK